METVCNERFVARHLSVAMELAICLSGWPAAAIETGSDPAPPVSGRLYANEDGTDRLTAEQRPFVFLEDPSTPSARVWAFRYGLSLGSRGAALRPVPIGQPSDGAINQFSLGYGMTDWLEPVVDLVASDTNGNIAASERVGAKFQLTSPDSRWRAAVLAGGLHEGTDGASVAWMQASGSYTAGHVLFEANAYLEHVFASGRDSLDYIAMLGGSYMVTPWIRAGAEYVGQDLEEALDPGAEGGARMGFGPDLAFSFAGNRFQFVIAALLGLTRISPAAIMSASVLANY
jgi:hypothetical protein